MRRLITRLVQSLGLALVAYLFVCLMATSLRQTAFSLALPELVEPTSNSTVELLLLTLPAQLLFVLAGCWMAGRAAIIAAFVLLGAGVAWLQCMLFAESFGNTWSNTEVLLLLGVNLHWLLLALIPGLALLLGAERLRKPGA